MWARLFTFLEIWPWRGEKLKRRWLMLSVNKNAASFVDVVVAADVAAMLDM